MAKARTDIGAQALQNIRTMFLVYFFLWPAIYIIVEVLMGKERRIVIGLQHHAQMQAIQRGIHLQEPVIEITAVETVSPSVASRNSKSLCCDWGFLKCTKRSVN